jgi:hypothetical protein
VSSPNDPVAEQRARVEQARSDLVSSVDALGGRAVATREEVRRRVVRVAVPAAAAVVGLVLVRAALRRRRR